MEGEKINNNYDLKDPNGSGFKDFSNYSSRKQKVNSILILVIGLLAIVFGAFSFWFTVSNPFSAIVKESERINQEALTKRQAEIEHLKTLDTDGDGLSDYDELYVYGTSPYLKDSDGDGISDYDEVMVNRTDPNCPEGMICSGLPMVMPNLNLTSTEFSVTNTANTIVTAPMLVTDPTAIGTAITPDYIRSIMKNNGATDEELAELSDQVITAEFRDYLKSNPEVVKHFEDLGMDVYSFMNPANNLNLSSLSDINSVEDLKQLSGAQIRQLMINSGASESILGAFNDEQLKQLFLERLTEQFE
jgi:hypothetical protein